MISRYFLVWEKICKTDRQFIRMEKDRNLKLAHYNFVSRYMGRKRLVKSESEVEGSKFLVRAGYSYWTLGYILSESGARKLIGAAPLGKLIPVDEFLPILSDTHPEYVR